MSNLPQNVIPFPVSYRRPLVRQPTRARVDRMGRLFEAYPSREERIRELVDVVRNWRG